MDWSGNLGGVRGRMAAACERAGREPGSVRLIAVSKGHRPESVREVARLGVMEFGESRVQEAKAKVGFCGGGLRWHMIGHLQTNKCRDAARLFDMVQSVDSLHVATELNKWLDRLGKTMPILLEVNVAGEASKYGYAPEQLLRELVEINRLRRLEIHGLMGMAPWTPEAEKARPVFRRLRELKERCEGELGVPLAELSMGMTGDFEVAIEEGATMVRVGTALFGQRS